MPAARVGHLSHDVAFEGRGHHVEVGLGDDLTLLNANPFMTRLFCYDDLPFMLWFGTLMYGTWFVVTLPLWFPIDETPDVTTPWREVLTGALAGFMLVLPI